MLNPNTISQAGPSTQPTTNAIDSSIFHTDSSTTNGNRGSANESSALLANNTPSRVTDSCGFRLYCAYSILAGLIVLGGIVALLYFVSKAAENNDDDDNYVPPPDTASYRC